MMSATKNKLVLIGFMGTGKSSVSRLLAERLGWLRVDADEEIVRREGRSIADIFSRDGEEAFRAIESQVLRSLLANRAAAVVATGGGAVLKKDNRHAMLEHGFVVALKAAPEVIIARVSRDEGRPLLQGNAEARVHALLAQRAHAYDFAHLSIDTTDLTVDEVVEHILRQWRSGSFA